MEIGAFNHPARLPDGCRVSYFDLMPVEEARRRFHEPLRYRINQARMRAAADLAGSMRLEYPVSIKVVELPCTGKFDAFYALRAFEDGADGVMVAG